MTQTALDIPAFGGQLSKLPLSTTCIRSRILGTEELVANFKYSILRIEPHKKEMRYLPIPLSEINDNGFFIVYDSSLFVCLFVFLFARSAAHHLQQLLCNLSLSHYLAVKQATKQLVRRSSWPARKDTHQGRAAYSPKKAPPLVDKNASVEWIVQC